LANCECIGGEANPGRLKDLPIMRLSFLFTILWRNVGGMILVALLAGTAAAQGASLAALNDDPLSFDAHNIDSAIPSVAAVPPVVASALPEAPMQHRFWDTQNRVLFATVAALSAADFAVTRANLQNGGKELNPVTRLFSGSTAGLAANFAGETAGIIGLSYCFHKTGHHQLERITPLFNIGASSFAVVYDLSHRH
jgi:hypothetical protein